MLARNLELLELFSSYEKYEKEFQRIHGEIEKQLRYCIDNVNNIAYESANIEAYLEGYHKYGHYEIQKAFRRLNFILERSIHEEGTFAKFLDPNSMLPERYSLNILRYGYPIPFLSLARLDTGSWDKSIVVEYLIKDQSAFRKFSPATPYLLIDSRNKIIYDVSHIPIKNDSNNYHNSWKRTRSHEIFAETSLRLHEIYARNGFIEIGMIAEKSNLINIQSILLKKSVADYRYSSKLKKKHNRHNANNGAVLALSHTVPEELFDYLMLPIENHVHSEITMLTGKITEPLIEYLSKSQYGGCALRHRTLGNIQMGLPHDSLLPKETLKRLKEIDDIAASLEPQILQLLSTNPSIAYLHEQLFPPVEAIDAVDLESSSDSRKVIAATYVQEKFFNFHEKILAPVYSNLMLDYNTCPMPFEGILPIEVRLKAAVGAQLMGNFQKFLSTPPEYLFNIPDPPKNISKAESDAINQMLKIFQGLLKQRLIFEEIKNLFGNVINSILENWLAYFEESCVYRGSGISDVGELIFPAFFFSDERFELLLRYELPDFVNSWRQIRNRLTKIELYYNLEKKDWLKLRMEIIKPIIDEFLKMSLQVVGYLSDKEQIRNPLPPSTINPFIRPASFLDRKNITVKEANAPIEVVNATPGIAFQYQKLVERNRNHIRRLKEMETPSVIVRPVLVHARDKGQLIDPRALPRTFTGRFWRTIKRTPQRTANKRNMLLILMDFSGSMNKNKVDAAKDLAISLAEAFIETTDTLFYLYTTGGPGYRLIRILDSRNRDAAQMASLATPETESGYGWNPDSAALLAGKHLLKEAGIATDAVIVHISDFELCTSLNLGLPNAEAELHYALQQIVPDHHYIAARVGNNNDPVTNIEHDYIYLGEGNILNSNAILKLAEILRKIL